MAPKMAFMPLFPPFVIVMSICEHRHSLQNRPDARKTPPRAGLFPPFLPLLAALGPFFTHFRGPARAGLRASPEVALPPPMLATRKRIERLYHNHLFLAQHLDA